MKETCHIQGIWLVPLSGGGKKRKFSYIMVYNNVTEPVNGYAVFK